jgi:hypothetical protein
MGPLLGRQTRLNKQEMRGLLVADGRELISDVQNAYCGHLLAKGVFSSWSRMQ